MKTRSHFLSAVFGLAAAAAVGITAWTTPSSVDAWRPTALHRAIVALKPQPAMDSAHWASLINAYTDPTLGMVSRDSARGDSLLRFPGAIGWGAAALPCQDSLRAGSGSIKIWQLTDTAKVSTAGSLRAAYDSVNLYDDASTCQYIVAATGGNYRFDNTAAPNYDFMQNWRILGQMTQGSGFNYYTGNPRVRRVSNYGYEYLNMYRTLFNDNVSPFDGSSVVMNTRRSYLRHISIAFGGEDGDVAVTYSAGTEAVLQINDTSEMHTVQNMMIGELDSVRPLHMIFGGTEEPDDKQRRITVIGNYMHGSGWRMPNIATANRAQFIQNVSYNATNRAAEFGKGGRWDLIDYYARNGPQTTASGTQGTSKGWPVMILGAGDVELWRRGYGDSTKYVTVVSGQGSDWAALQPITPDTTSFYLSGIRGWQNGFAVGADSADLYRGANRVVSCDIDFLWFYPAHTSGPTYCEADGDSIPLDAVNDSMMAFIARYAPLPLSDRAPSADTDPMPSEAFTDTVVARTMRFSGNSRYLLCTGEWAFRSDSVKTRFMQEWIDSTDAGDHGAAGGVTDGSRSYGSTTGSACADTDGDGMPDAYESANSASTTALAVDSMSYGRAAYEWYVDGRHLDGTLVGCENFLCAAEEGSLPDTIPAFAGAGGQAYGWGATALHDSRSLPLNVLFVTNTSELASVSGSFYERLLRTSDTTYDIIMFNTGGRFWKTAGVILSDSSNKTLNHVYIAGQTAPGGGFVQTGQRIIHQSGTHYGQDVVMRYFSIYKVGSTALRICGDRVMFDHLSGGMGGSGGSGNIFDTCERLGTPEHRPGVLTMQNTLAAESHEDHPTIIGFSGRLQSGHRNFLAGPSRRLPNMGSDTSTLSGYEITNNIIYNQGPPGGYYGQPTGQSVGDFRFNYTKPGPGHYASPGYRGAVVHWGSNCDTVSRYPNGCTFDFLYEGNRNHINGYRSDVPIDSSWINGEMLCEYTGGALDTFDPNCAVNDTFIPQDYRRAGDTTIWVKLGQAPYWPYTNRTTMSDAYVDSILDDVGNSKRLNCDGTFTHRRQPFDSVAIQNFRDSTGRSTAHTYSESPIYARHPDTAPAIPAPAAGTPCAMTADGLYHEWLFAMGFDTTSPPPADSVTNSGYLLIETMLNGSDPDASTPWTGSPTGGGGGGGGGGGSFGVVARYIYFVPTQTLFGVVFPLFTPINEIEYAILNAAEDTMMVVACTENTVLGTAADSATVNGRVAAWARPGINTAVLARDFTPFAGMGC